MKIKEVCSKTGLTERTIRFYVEKGLLRPESSEVNGRVYYEFAVGDVESLLGLALLRKVGFSIDSILDMQRNPEHIDGTFQAHLSAMLEKENEHRRVVAALRRAGSSHFASLAEATRALAFDAADMPLPQSDLEPNFARFDSETREEREQGYLDFLIDQRIRDRAAVIGRPFGIVAKVAGILLAALLVVYAITCIPKTISREYEGLDFRAIGESAQRPVHVAIEGKLYRRLFQSPVFKGTVEVDAYDFTKANAVELEFPHGTGEGAWLVYSSLAKEGDVLRPDLHSFAQVYADDGFRQVVFLLFEPVDEDAGTIKDLVICAPAASAEEGRRMLADWGLLELVKQYAESSAGQ